MQEARGHLDRKTGRRRLSEALFTQHKLTRVWPGFKLARLDFVM